MERAIALIKEHGCLCRYGRGFWQKPNDPVEGKTGSGKTTTYFPLDFIPNNTVTNLIKRNEVVVTERRKLNGYETPVKISLP